jgi:type IV secretory pathway protease TraF
MKRFGWNASAGVPIGLYAVGALVVTDLLVASR